MIRKPRQPLCSHGNRWIVIAIILALSGIVLPAQDLANPNASSNTRAVYEYLKSVGRAGATHSLILGQHAGHGSTITRASAHPNKLAATWDSFCFDRYVRPIFDQTGKWPGMLSLDYEFDYPRLFEGYDDNPFTSLREPNRKLKEWWAEGGLVTINWSPANPWSPGTSGYYGTILPGVNLQDLTNSALAWGKSGKGGWMKWPSHWATSKTREWWFYGGRCRRWMASGFGPANAM